MQHVSSDPPISWNSGFNLLKLIIKKSNYMNFIPKNKSIYLYNSKK